MMTLLPVPKFGDFENENFDPAFPRTTFRIHPVWAAISLVSGAASTYHGYKRNQSIGWALGWGLLGSMFPIIVPTIAVAQGFGKPKKGVALSGARRRRRRRRS